MKYFCNERKLLKLGYFSFMILFIFLWGGLAAERDKRREKKQRDFCIKPKKKKKKKKRSKSGKTNGHVA